ncbi:MAG: DegT/DnrJ/EryC1/StrS family aminotransferase [Planctomycetia bacterium]|nr:DegT/DnrJ/EryC1/StrS family aminotransferase [Planctomycetia bacterium]
MVNSGSSANLITLAALRHLRGPGEIILPPLTWVSDVAAVLHNGFEPVFVDINPRTLGLDTEQVIERLSPKTRAVFITHVLGYSALTERLLAELARRNIPLIEDVCESHGATFRGRKLGTFGLASNFSFYFAHHMSTIEGGMVSTDDAAFYEKLRMLRSHGMVREASLAETKAAYAERHSDLNPDFIFAHAAYNVRSTELNAVLGLSQLGRLDERNARRRANLDLFLQRLDPEKYFTDFDTEGSCNYAFTLLLKKPNDVLRDNVVRRLRSLGVEFRRGMSGGGNQLRQPYLRGVVDWDKADFPCVEHVHFYGFYLGNYPSLTGERIAALCDEVNAIPDDRPLTPSPLALGGSGWGVRAQSAVR